MTYLNTDKVSNHSQKLLKDLNKLVVGQQPAKNAIVDLLEKYKGGFGDKARPIGSMLFLGPTGTGKTRIVEAACESLFGSEYACLKIDCGEFQHSSDIAKLIGSPPGYIGHTETPARLKQETLDKFHNRQNKFTFILFDEIEKASDAVWHLMLSILDKGTLTLGNNVTSDFTKCIIVMTSNAGSAEINSAFDSMGFVDKKETPKEKLAHIAVEAAKRKFTPEFINRIDRIVAFHTLSETDSLNIVSIELERLQKRVLQYAEPFFFVKATKKAKEQLVVDGYNQKENGRNIRRAIERNVEIPLARGLTTEQISPKDTVTVDYSKDFGYTFQIENSPE
jgi:ATP-dependent Clp protease ATP-binding subunit ClpB